MTDSTISFYHLLDNDNNSVVLQTWSTHTLQTLCKAENNGLHYPVDQAGVWTDCIRQRQPVIHNDYASLSHRKGMPAGQGNLKYKIWNPLDHWDHGFVNGKDKIDGIWTVETLDLGEGEAPVYTIRHHVDLFLQGHDHTYARTHKVRFREVVGDKEQGTIYCTSVASPKQYPWNPRYEYVMSRIGQDKQLYQIISVEPDKLKYQSFTASGEAYDSFELKKDSAGQTQLLEYDGAASRPSVSATRPSPVTKPAAVPVAK